MCRIALGDLDPVKHLGVVLAKVDVLGISDDHLGRDALDEKRILVVDEHVNASHYGGRSRVLVSHYAKMAQGHLILLSL